MSIDPIPIGADPVWQPNGYLLTDQGWIAFCHPWLIWLNEGCQLAREFERAKNSDAEK